MWYKIKNFFTQKIDLNYSFKFSKNWPYFLTGVFSSLVTLFLVFILIWNFRVSIFTYLVNEHGNSLASKSELSNSDGLVDLFLKSAEVKLDPQVINNEQKEYSVLDTVRKTNPAVVSIIVTKEVPKYEAYIDPNQNNNPFGDLFPGFNFNIPQYRQNGTEKKRVGGGSGFFVSADGLIVTNRHVVNLDDAEYAVYTSDGKEYVAKVVARDKVYDIALIKITGTRFPFLEFGDSDRLELGQTVVAIGNALAEFKNSVSVGIISGLSRSIRAGDATTGRTEMLDSVIQTDAAINPGNSGGPLIDLFGRVVGVNVAVAQGGENIGFAIPINNVKSAVASFKSTGKIVRPYVGIRYVVINPEVKIKNNLSVDYGVWVKAGEGISEPAVLPASPAERAGLAENDIILEIDGTKLDDKASFASIIRGKRIGQNIRLRVLSKGLEKNVYLRLEAAPD